MPIVNKLDPAQKKLLASEITRIEAEKGHKICGARTRVSGRTSDKPCEQRAGFRTDHAGIGRCFLHGGHNQSPASKNFKHGERSSLGIKYPGILEKIEQLRQDRDVFDLRDHIFLAEAIAQEILQEAENTQELLEVVKVIDTITKAVQRLHDIEVGRRYVISVENLGSIIGRVVEVIERHVPDPYLRSLIAADIIRLNSAPIPALDAKLIEGKVSGQ